MLRYYLCEVIQARKGCSGHGLFPQISLFRRDTISMLFGHGMLRVFSVSWEVRGLGVWERDPQKRIS